MITIHIDNKPYQVKEGQNLLQACLSLGFDLPYFCWHPAMHSVGACRQCAVKQFKDDKDTRGRIVMSCMTPVAEGLRISVDDPEATSFRKGVAEWLMLNHPHDCPVCDEGGECHLQDMTVMTGQTYRRTRFRKRTHRNQDLGPFINHEMNRCIQCYRCVRFYRDYAGGRDLHVFASHDHVYFGRHEDGVLESEFSGNLVEVCPTGVFTDKTFKRHYTRKWDLQTAPSICVHCGIGCNTIAGERYGTLRRILNRYHHDVNGYFLCDRGRFGYEFVNSDIRIRQPLVKSTFMIPTPPPPLEGGGAASSPAAGQGLDEGAQPVSKEAALARIKGVLATNKGIIGIGSPRASLESNFVLRTLVGPENFHTGMSDQEQRLASLIILILAKGPARAASLRDVQMADAVLVLGEDVTNTAPLLALSLRQSVRRRGNDIAAKIKVPSWDDAAVRNAAQNERSPLFIASPTETKLDELAAKTYRAAPDDLARLGFAVAHELDPDAPAVNGLPGDVLTLAKEIAEELGNAKHPLIVSGTSLGSDSLLQAAANVAWALCGSGKPAQLCYAVPECNTLGLGLIGGKSLGEAFTSVHDGKADTIIILENDLYRRADENNVRDFLQGVKSIIVIDHLFNRTSMLATTVLPAATFAEGSGTLVNNEGRAQRFYQVFAPQGTVQEGWRWLLDILTVRGNTRAGAGLSFHELITDMISALPVFAPLTDIAPPSDFRVQGLKIPRQPHRYSGRTAMRANISVHEPKPPEDPDTPLAFSMEGYEGQPPSPLISRYWSPGWNSAQAVNKFQQETGGPLRGGDPGKRLINPPPSPIPVRGTVGSYFTTIPDAYQPRDGEQPQWPVHQIFGSEELSLHAPGIAELAKSTTRVGDGIQGS